MQDQSKQARRTKIEGRDTANIYKARSGRFEIAYRAGGKLQWFSCPVGWTLAEAKAKRAELTIAKRDGTLPVASKLRVNELADLWLTQMKSEWTAGTYSLRETNLRVHILPVLGHVKARELNEDHAWQLVLALREKELSKSTQRLIVFGIFGSLCNWSVDERHLTSNPTRALSRQRRKQLTSDEQENVKVIHEPAALLLATADGFRLLFKVALICGPRIGELLGLRVRDIGAEHLRIRGQLDRTTRAHTDRCKTGKSRRDVELPASLRDELLTHVEGLGPDELIFRTDDGRGFLASTIQRAFKIAAKRAGLDESLTFHSLRHTAASKWIADGESVTYVQNQLGHKTPDITLKVYSHLLDQRDRATARRERADSYAAELSRPALRLVAGGEAS